MNDIWYLGQGQWVAYTEDMQTAMDFASIPEMKHVTTYYNNLGKRKALQFRFFQGRDLRPGQCLLHYACRSLGLDFAKVLKMAGNAPGIPYREMFTGYGYQPELFDLFERYEPGRKKTARRIKG